MKKALLTLLTMLSSCSQQKKHKLENALQNIDGHAYQRFKAPVKSDLPARIKLRMLQPFILAGEDVELLSQELDSWFAQVSDTQLLEIFKVMDVLTLAAIDQFIDPSQLSRHTKSMEYMKLNCTGVKPFPAKLIN